MRFSSEEFYQSSLIAHSSVQRHRLSDLPGVKSNNMTDIPLAFIDTAGAGYDEQLESDGGRFDWKRPSVCRSGASCWTRESLRRTLPSSRLTRRRSVTAEQLLPWGIDVDTVDGFKGREKEAVVISLVRSNSQGEIGFLADTRRTTSADLRPPQTHYHRRQCHDRSPSVLSAVAGILRTAGRLSPFGRWVVVRSCSSS